uniref:V-SNARE coiled-coil homology domain-containing protein n=1 Tax=Calcidiscus leptoporus TaxID=127549 RepID=A0A7S0J027_9EUKA|mmetsp:Transcript_32139/g.74888  ORF Transcript_32139/g.74888 Transcript_32139/m.74888 type:complete len:222 (+) Transcript_32139:62-727(+)
MPIIYSLVARGTCVLAEFTGTSGNFTTVTRRILEKLPREDSRMSYVYDSHVFHYLVANGLVYLCMAGEDFGRRLPFAFLEDVARKWMDMYGERGQTALAYGMNEDFSRVLERAMAYFSKNPASDPLRQVHSEIEEVRAVMVENIEKVLERGEKIELLVDKTENLNQQAFRFKKSSTALKRTMYCKNLKITLLIVFIVLVVILVIVFSACGIDFHNCGAGRH